MLKNGTERAAPAPEPPDELGDRAHEAQERKRRLRFAGMVVLVVVLGGFLLFFDNILGFFTSGKPKGPGLLDRKGAQISRLSDTERRRILDEIRVAIAKDHMDKARTEVLSLLQRDSSPEAHFLAGTVYLRQGNIKGAYDHLKEATRLRNDYAEAHSKLGEIYVMVGDYKSASSTATLLSQKPEFLGDGLLLESEIALGQGNLIQAAQKAEEAFAKAAAPISPKQIVYMADIHLRQGDRKKSEAWIRRIDQTRLDAEGYLSLGKYYLAASDEGKAAAYLEEALRRYPATPEVHYTYGQYLHSRRKYVEAADHFQKAQAALPNVQIIAYHLGRSLLAAGEREKTRVLIDAMIAKDPVNILAWRLKTQYHLAQGERQAAMATLNQLIRYIPDSAASYALLAELNLQEGILSLAERNARKAIGLGDQSISPHLVLGDCLFRRGRYEQAIESYGKALAMQPSNLAALLQTGDALLNLGQVEKAETTYRQALQAYPNVGIIQAKMARAKATQGDRTAALTLARQYYEKHPTENRAITEYANALVMNDRIEEAQSVLSRSINANPGNWFLHYAQGDLWLLKRDIPSALQSFQRAASLNPNDVNLALNLAKRLEQAGLTREAGEQYLRAYRLAPKAMPVVNEAAWFFIDTVNTPQQAKEMVELLKARGEGANEKDTVGWYHFQIGDAKTAEFYIREALLLDPNNATIRGHLALLLAETKRDKEAVLEAGKILQQLPPGKLKDRVGSLLTKGAK